VNEYGGELFGLSPLYFTNIFIIIRSPLSSSSSSSSSLSLQHLHDDGESEGQQRLPGLDPDLGGSRAAAHVPADQQVQARAQGVRRRGGKRHVRPLRAVQQRGHGVSPGLAPHGKRRSPPRLKVDATVRKPVSFYFFNAAFFNLVFIRSQS